MTPSSEDVGEKETARLEAFSDGVFAIAMTLLVLDIKVPGPSELASAGSLLAALCRQWPMYLAYFTSFATILVMWVNHHKLFCHIYWVDDPFLFLNGLLLLFVALVPFPTALVSEYLRHPQATTAAAIYAGTYEAIAIAFNLLWFYASKEGRLLGPRADLAEARAITRQYRVGPIAYLAAFLLAFVSVPACLGLCLLLALFFGFTRVLSLFGAGRELQT